MKLVWNPSLLHNSFLNSLSFSILSFFQFFLQSLEKWPFLDFQENVTHVKSNKSFFTNINPWRLALVSVFVMWSCLTWNFTAMLSLIWLFGFLVLLLLSYLTIGSMTWCRAVSHFEVDQWRNSLRIFNKQGLYSFIFCCQLTAALIDHTQGWADWRRYFQHVHSETILFF